MSLAAALAIPLTTANGQPFPGRDLIIFLAYSVILVTVIGQGLDHLGHGVPPAPAINLQ